MKRKDIDANLANTIRQLRVLRNIKQEHVAEELGVGVSTYTRMEGGKITIPFTMIKALAGLYNMSIDELVNFQEVKGGESSPKDTALSGDLGVRTSHLRTIAITVELDGSDNYFKAAMKKIELVQKSLKNNPL